MSLVFLNKTHSRSYFFTQQQESCSIQIIIDLGKSLPKLDSAFKVPENRVKGCQSIVYLHTQKMDRVLLFSAESDALISQGLAALLIKVYSGETPDTLLKCPPTFLEELDIPSSLTPNRANGLYSMHLRMQQEALKHLLSV